MARYVCPEGDHEQETPGMCPNHQVELVMAEDEGMDEDMGEGMDEEAGTEEMPDEEEE